MKVLIVGNGLAGSIMCRLLKKRQPKWEVVVMANDAPMSASKASSNLFCDSWVKKWHGGGRRGLEILHELYEDAITIPFPIEVKRVEQVMCAPDIIDTCTFVDDGVAIGGEGEYTFDKVILCTGPSKLLVDGPPIQVKTGHALIFSQPWEGPGVIKPVRPYCQEKIMPWRGCLTYYADSVAIIDKNYWKRREELVKRSKGQALKHGLTSNCVELVGQRPVMKHHPYGWWVRYGNRLAINGGGKNGMVAYANIAERVLESINAS